MNNCLKCGRPMNEGNSPNKSECTETDDDEGVCAAWAEVARRSWEVERLNEEVEENERRLRVAKASEERLRAEVDLLKFAATGSDADWEAERASNNLCESDLAAAYRVIAHQQITCTEQLEELRRLRAAVLKCEADHADHASLVWAANLPR